MSPLLTLLQSGATEDEIGAHLNKEISEHFGLPLDRHDVGVVAARVRDWFNLGWRDVEEPVVVFVALLDEGVDVWRPVQARPLGANRFRIVGVDADVSSESWQFPAGSIVRYERRKLSDDQLGLAAVNRVEGAG